MTSVLYQLEFPKWKASVPYLHRYGFGIFHLHPDLLCPRGATAFLHHHPFAPGFSSHHGPLSPFFCQPCSRCRTQLMYHFHQVPSSLTLEVIVPLGAVFITSSAYIGPHLFACLSALLCGQTLGFHSECQVPGIVSETWSHIEPVTPMCTSLSFYVCYISWKLLTD